MYRTLPAALLALGLILPAWPAAADETCRGPVSRAQAEAVARGAGLVRITDVDCDDDEWEIEGQDARGREMEVEISAADGRILEIERD
ncbi:PepSY domain-containing protein [Falsiroseomonas selenitidurans]|uniref:PepSY domain-containing protein n=1 Tax=Falsiroseomonas selenitidurans TaxID=2716335 RepID=A0ABX1E8Y4_9PROT|nr:PepSY domain-containing protein [Falsiroseomonas selenitidurans]NKC33679.1 PepSY domain-containing protein [Falsiroseomonas selenitidurans]